MLMMRRVAHASRSERAGAGDLCECLNASVIWCIYSIFGFMFFLWSQTSVDASLCARGHCLKLILIYNQLRAQKDNAFNVLNLLFLSNKNKNRNIYKLL